MYYRCIHYLNVWCIYSNVLIAKTAFNCNGIFAVCLTFVYFFLLMSIYISCNYMKTLPHHSLWNFVFHHRRYMDRIRMRIRIQSMLRRYSVVKVEARRKEILNLVLGGVYFMKFVGWVIDQYRIIAHFYKIEILS